MPLTCFRLKKGRATFFRPETIVASFLHFMVSLFKMLLNYYVFILIYVKSPVEWNVPDGIYNVNVFSKWKQPKIIPSFKAVWISSRKSEGKRKTLSPFFSLHVGRKMNKNKEGKERVVVDLNIHFNSISAVLYQV